MNAYVVRTSESRVYTEPVMDDGSGPQFDYWPTDVFLAEKPGEAKRDALRLWSQQGGSGVYTDDYQSLRCRLLSRDVEGERGVVEPRHPAYHELWHRVHEVLDHPSGKCDCETADLEYVGSEA